MLSDAQLIRSLGLRSRVAIKRELQRLIAEHDAVAAFVCTAAENGNKSASIEFAGDRDALPRWNELGGRASCLCDQRVLRSNDREERAVVLLYSRLCTDAPTLVLGLVEPGTPFTDVLTEDIENAVVRIESIVVDVLDPSHDAPSAVKPRSKPSLAG